MDIKNILHAKKNCERQAKQLYHLKILIPVETIGSIIGKGGSIITNLETTYDVKISLSCFNDTYPGTNDRVCLISGNIKNILLVNDFIMSRVNLMTFTGYDVCYDYDHKKSVDRSKIVKFIIPHCSAAKIIGYRGANIKKMKSISGSFIQISQQAFYMKLDERCIIVAGELENNRTACQMIFLTIADDTRLLFYQNVSYSTINVPIPSAFPTGPPFAETKKIYAGIQKLKNVSESYGTDDCGKNNESSVSNSYFLDAVQTTLREKGYNDSMIKPVKEAINVLMNYGVLNICLASLINFENSVSPFGTVTDSKTTTFAQDVGNEPVSFNNTGTYTMKAISSDFSDRCENFINNPVFENQTSSFFTSGINQDATNAPNYLSLWGSSASPLVSVNNCAHINVSNYPSGPSELSHDVYHLVNAGKNSSFGKSIVLQKFL